MAPEHNVRLFVYGTLMPGAAQFRLLEQHVSHHEPAIIESGWLFHMPGGYPALVLASQAPENAFKAPSTRIHGVLCELTSSALWPRLDAYEGCDMEHPEHGLYVRLEIPLAQPTGVCAWTYTWNPGRLNELKAMGQHVPRGRWGKF